MRHMYTITNYNLQVIGELHQPGYIAQHTYTLEQPPNSVQEVREKAGDFSRVDSYRVWRVTIETFIETPEKKFIRKEESELVAEHNWPQAEAG